MSVESYSHANLVLHSHVDYTKSERLKSVLKTDVTEKLAFRSRRIRLFWKGRCVIYKGGRRIVHSAKHGHTQSSWQIQYKLNPVPGGTEAFWGLSWDGLKFPTQSDGRIILNNIHYSGELRLLQWEFLVIFYLLYIIYIIYYYISHSIIHIHTYWNWNTWKNCDVQIQTRNNVKVHARMYHVIAWWMLGQITDECKQIWHKMIHPGWEIIYCAPYDPMQYCR